MRGRHGWLGCGLALALAGACGESSPGGVGAAAGEGGEPSGASAAGGKRSAAAGAPDRGGSRPSLLGAAGNAAGGEAGAAAGTSSGPPEVVRGVDCNGEPFDLDGDIVRRCVLALSCLGPDGGMISSCVESWPTLAGYHLDVLGEGVLDRPLVAWTHLAPCATAPLDSCDDVLACSGMRAVVDECDGGLSTRCEGDWAIDCATRGITDCARVTGQSGSCRERGVAVACQVVEACSEQSGEYGCDGNKAYRCDDGVGYGVDCAERGMACYTLLEFSLCRDPELPAETCTNIGETVCVGDAMTYCNDDGVLFQDDCSQRNMTCIVGGREGATPVPPWLDCAVAGCPVNRSRSDRCVGDDLVLGLSMYGEAGAVLHCPDYGFRTCKVDRCAE